MTFLEQHPDVGAVCGRRRERFPDRSVYNWLCDLEWEGPAGDVRYCGGDVMVRTEALEAIGGYRDDMIAGEEPEMCVRLREAGWKIWRLDTDMTLHDAAITRFGQWWTRALARRLCLCPWRPSARRAARTFLGLGIAPRLDLGRLAAARLPRRRPVVRTLGLGSLADLSVADRAPGGAQSRAVDSRG